MPHFNTNLSNQQRLILPALLLTLISLIASEAFSFANRVTEFPNNQWGCAGCHVNPAGAGPRTVFGEDIFMFGRDGASMNWAGVCDLDSDGDGASNGA